MTTHIMSNIGRKLQLALVSTVLASSLAVAVPALSAAADDTPTPPPCAAYDLVGAQDGGPDGNVSMLDIFAVITRDRAQGVPFFTLLDDIVNAASHFGQCPPAEEAS